MNIELLSKLAERAFKQIFSLKKFLLTLAFLSVCGLIPVFFWTLATETNYWLRMGLIFFPLLLIGAILFPAGILLIRVYHHEVKKKAIDFKKMMLDSMDTLISAAYFSFPVLLIYLCLWFTLGIFALIIKIPYLGPIFAFIPFLLNFASLLLCILNLLLLFFVTPILALKGIDKKSIYKNIQLRLNESILANLILLLLALTPLIISTLLLICAAWLTTPFCPDCNITALEVEWFFIMIPFAAILTPALIFFFNFAAESQAYFRTSK